MHNEQGKEERLAEGNERRMVAISSLPEDRFEAASPGGSDT